jgi:hypothetical protein
MAMLFIDLRVQANNVATPPNPFYGTRVPTKKGVSVHLKEDFNPFRHSKVADASQVCKYNDFGCAWVLTFIVSIDMAI